MHRHTITFSGHVEQAESEIDNLRAAFIWSRENNDIANALEMATSLQPLWLMRGRVLEGGAWLDAAVSGSDSSVSKVSPALRARALADTAMLNSWLEITDALEQADEALALAGIVGDPALLTRALAARCSVLAHDYELSRPYFTEAITLARELDDSWRLCQIFGRQTYSAFVAGDLVVTESVASEGLELANGVGDHFGAGQCAWALIGVHIHRGEVVAALEMLMTTSHEPRWHTMSCPR